MTTLQVFPPNADNEALFGEIAGCARPRSR